jgi:2-polyprenyl-6-methoxyphenol hydroxylase-like FAD-dependent oxidoreductase
MLKKARTELLVVGAGPVGLFAALAAANRGLNVRIIDRAGQTGAHSYGLALHPATYELLDSEGVRDSVLGQAHRIRNIAIADRTGVQVTIPIASLEDDFSFVSVVRQDVLENALEETLRKQGVAVGWHHEASLIREKDDHVEVRVDRLESDSRGYGIEHSEQIVVNSRTYETAFVIGADGYESDVRQSLGIDYEEVGGAVQYAVFEFATDLKLDDTMMVVLHKGTTSVFWPMPDGFCRWAFEITTEQIRAARREKDRFITESPDHVSAALFEFDLLRLLEERAPWFIGNIKALTWKKIVRFDRRLASGFGRGRVWLAGDAAHMTAPGGVQSMNVGMQEVHRLVELMYQVLREDRTVTALDIYDEERWLEWRLLHGIDPLQASNGASPSLIDNLKQILPNLPLSGRSLKLAMKTLGARVEVEPVRAI